MIDNEPHEKRLDHLQSGSHQREKENHAHSETVRPQPAKIRPQMLASPGFPLVRIRFFRRLFLVRLFLGGQFVVIQLPRFVVVDETQITPARIPHAFVLHRFAAGTRFHVCPVHSGCFAITLARAYTNMITLALQAMATRFELVLSGNSPGLRAAGEEALAEVARIESMLSLYKPTSEAAVINGRAAAEPVRVSTEMFALLQRAISLCRETNGAFDISIAPLVRCWGFMRGQGSVPTDEQITEAQASVGFEFLELNAADRTVRFLRPGMMLDFGAFGKGYAVDCAIDFLREAGVESALLHGGTSTVVGIGCAENGAPWKVAVTGAPHGDEVLWLVELQNNSLGVSAVWGKSFAAQGQTFGHILDARTGRPSQRAELAAVNVSSAAESDALSTALLVEGPLGLKQLGQTRPGARALVLASGKIFRHKNDEPVARSN